MLRICFLLLLSGWFLLPSQMAGAQEVQTDFDTDGGSDQTVVRIQADNSLLWLSRGLAASSATQIGEFGRSGDHLIVARWRGLSKPEVGVVTLDRTTRKVTWKIVDQIGDTQQVEFGKRGDLLISGADFNADGIADAAVARKAGRAVKWDIWPNMLAASGSSASPVATLRFGRNGDRLFFVSPDGGGDWMGRLGKTRSGRAIVKLKSFVSGEVRSYAGYPAFAVSAQRPRPFPLRSPSAGDVLGFELANGSGTSYVFTNLDGSEFYRKTVTGKPIAVVGEFLADAGEELAYATDGEWSVLNPFSGAESALTSLSGIPVDEINVNTLTRSSSNNNGSDPDPTPPPGGNPGSECARVSPWPGSHIYKTIGSNHFTDIRRNTIGLVIKAGGVGPFPNCVAALDTKGNQVAVLGLYAKGAGWAARYYAGIGCGSGTPYNGSRVASIARSNTGSSSIYMNFGTVCYGPIDANQCIGSGQC